MADHQVQSGGSFNDGRAQGVQPWWALAHEVIETGGRGGASLGGGNGQDLAEPARSLFQALRSPAGEEMVLEKNMFVEQLLPGAVLRDLSKAEMDVYRAPFAELGERRRPTLTWPRMIPFDGEPADVSQRIAAYGKWMAENDIPKLFI
ncbi:hypothetical protein HQ590_11945, partial [bacterium]|nr:hypothetical protein [bacterium]